MWKSKWESLTQVIDTEINPFLKQRGYLAKEPEGVEQRGVYLGYTSSNINNPQIIIHGTKIPNLEYGKKPDYVSFVQVNLGATQLKTLQDTSTETHWFLKIGWIYGDDIEMLVCIGEIAAGLKKFFNIES